MPSYNVLVDGMPTELPTDLEAAVVLLDRHTVTLPDGSAFDGLSFLKERMLSKILPLISHNQEKYLMQDPQSVRYTKIAELARRVKSGTGTPQANASITRLKDAYNRRESKSLTDEGFCDFVIAKDDAYTEKVATLEETKMLMESAIIEYVPNPDNFQNAWTMLMDLVAATDFNKLA